MSTHRTQPSEQAGSRRGVALLGVGVVSVVILFMLLSGGEEAGRELAIRATLGGDDVGRAVGGEWTPDRPPVDLESVARVAGAFVPVPDDRHASAWRDRATGASAFQITLVYDDEADAIALESGAASGLLRQHFGLDAAAMEIEGADSARRHAAPDGFQAISVRIGRGVVFVGGLGLDARAGDELPELEWSHQGTASPRLLAIAEAAAARLDTVLEEARATEGAATSAAGGEGDGAATRTRAP